MSLKSVGGRLKTIRKFLNLNQDIVSKKLNITNQTLSRYENNTRFADSQFLQEFGRLYNVNANWLLYGIGDMFIKNADAPSESEQDVMKRLIFYLNKIEELFREQAEKS